jgi:hypothetical protein
MTRSYIVGNVFLCVLKLTLTETYSLFPLHKFIVKKKSKAVPLHVMEAHGGRGGITPTHT